MELGKSLEEPDRAAAAPYWDATGLTGVQLGRPKPSEDWGVLGQCEPGHFGPSVALWIRTETMMGNALTNHEDLRRHTTVHFVFNEESLIGLSLLFFRGGSVSMKRVTCEIKT